MVVSNPPAALRVRSAVLVETTYELAIMQKEQKEDVSRCQ